ncbi:hypothetical protein KIN20_003703 [Parelaphostrongylus tenuis]|uniref:Uncharacterized protein n=1 Tax=Parelaphostrongylus tenuis TaxID=148309 RepID=A0AAD5M1Y6_PARTN|nr:hypothetical protein KIN20_003703 [Parelaphostrongylus tenuis]
MMLKHSLKKTEWCTKIRPQQPFSEQLRAIVDDTVLRDIAAGPNQWSRCPLLRCGGQYRVVLASWSVVCLLTPPPFLPLVLRFCPDSESLILLSLLFMK